MVNEMVQIVVAAMIFCLVYALVGCVLVGLVNKSNRTQSKIVLAFGVVSLLFLALFYPQLRRK